ncbi:MAG: glycosyltransferase family 2 protein [Candidatus ainarchaeum sp.]|nr:glycosyltransferase family 2 protein [Candidatus ainarchaeum sp.]
MPKGISIVLPAYNEAKKIRNALKAIRNFLKKEGFKNYEIILVDDGSRDNTAEIARKQGAKVLVNKPNRGKGFSVSRGILAASKELVLFTDTDLSTPLGFLKEMLKFIPEYDVIIASRNLPGSNIKIEQPASRKVLGKIFAKFVSLLFMMDIKDTQCGFKLFKTEKAKKIFSKITTERWAFDVEVLVLAKKHHCKIKEIPVDWYNSIDSRLKLKSTLGMLADVLKIKLKYPF